MITLMSVIDAFSFAITLWYSYYHKVTLSNRLRPFQSVCPKPCWHWLTGGTFDAICGTFQSDTPGTFESNMDGTFKVSQSGLVGRVGVWLRRSGMVDVGMAKVKWGGGKKKESGGKIF